MPNGRRDVSVANGRRDVSVAECMRHKLAWLSYSAALKTEPTVDWACPGTSQSSAVPWSIESAPSSAGVFTGGFWAITVLPVREVWKKTLSHWMHMGCDTMGNLVNRGLAKLACKCRARPVDVLWRPAQVCLRQLVLQWAPLFLPHPTPD